MDYMLHIMVIAGIYMVLTLSLNLVVGYTGLPSLGHAAFSCAGAYASALLALNFGISPWIGMLVGALVALLLSLIIGIPALRVRGDYFALVTFGFGIIVYSVAKNWIGLTRGPLGLPGIPPVSVFGYSLSSTGVYLALVGVIVVITYLLIWRIVQSPYGRILKGIREDELVTEAMGHNVGRHKLEAFAIGAFFAGIAGSLYAHYITFIDPSSFTVTESITILLMVVFGGMGSLRGSLIGALTLVLVPELLRFMGLPSAVAAPLRQMLYGLLLILVMLRRPQGILGTFRWQ